MIPGGRVPDGWTHIDEDGAPYEKLVKRDAYEVEDLIGDPYTADMVIMIDDGFVAVTKGPAHRAAWTVPDPWAAARRLVRVLESWVAAGRDPYGGSCLQAQLTLAATLGVSP